MKESIYRMAELYAINSVGLTQLAEEVEKTTPTASITAVMQEVLLYAEHYKHCINAAASVGCEVLIDTPYDTFKAFVTKDDGEWVLVDHDGEAEKYHASCIQSIIDYCDE